MSSTASRAWQDANQACFDYLVSNLDVEPGKKAFIGDDLSLDQLDQWAFMINGGPTQDQAYGQSRPAKQWEGWAELVGVFETREEAMELAGAVRDLIPVRTIAPNVHLFRIRGHEQLTSVILNADDEDNRFVAWRLMMTFTVIYKNDTA
jgi:hypothetical protein